MKLPGRGCRLVTVHTRPDGARIPRSILYRALPHPRVVATWMVPNGMTSVVHAFDAREGGPFRISLTYDAPAAIGKTIGHTDTFCGRFVKLNSPPSPKAALPDLRLKLAARC